jgi:O-antigen ligase
LLLLVVAGGVLALKPLAPEAFDRYSERIVQAASFDERADSGRVDHLPACIELIKASPIWGYGISAISAADSSGSDVTTVNYMMVLMERGAVGAVMFFLPWFALAFRAWRLPRVADGRTLAFLALVMTLYSFCNFSLTYFLPFWLAFGVAAALVLRTYAPVVKARALSAPDSTYAVMTHGTHPA